MTQLNISEIIEQGSLYERAFFNWLNVERILWIVAGTDLNYINLFSQSDVEIVKEYWSELK